MVGLALVGSSSMPSKGVLGPQDKSFLLMLRWPLNQQRRPSISRQDQYSRVSGLARHSIVSAWAAGSRTSRARVSTIAAVTFLRIMSQPFSRHHARKRRLRGDAERLDELLACSAPSFNWLPTKGRAQPRSERADLPVAIAGYGNEVATSWRDANASEVVQAWFNLSFCKRLCSIAADDGG